MFEKSKVNCRVKYLHKHSMKKNLSSVIALHRFREAGEIDVRNKGLFLQL